MSAPARAPSVLLGGARWEALGTSVAVIVSEPAVLGRAREVVERHLAAMDRACSRFRTDSELTAVNAAGGRPTVVSALLAQAVRVALDAARATAGRVDPSLGRAIELAGYDRDFAGLEPPHDSPSGGDRPARGVVRARLRPGWEGVRLDEHRSTLTVPRGVRLDLGATAKALCADRAAAEAARETGAGVLVSLGGDVSVSGPAPDGGWAIGLDDDHRAAATPLTPVVSIIGGGLATSSTTARRWRHHGRDMHHILDPATGLPVNEVWRTVSVAAASCVEANTASTAAIVAGSQAPAWLDELGLPARLVGRDGSARTVGDWPAAQVAGP